MSKSRTRKPGAEPVAHKAPASARTAPKPKASAEPERKLAPAKPAAKPPAQRTPQEAAREAFRADLRIAAERVFAAKGFAATKMTDIATEAKVAVGTLYNYFPSKEEIFGELCASRSEDFYAQLAASLDHLPPLVKLEKMVRTSLDYLDEHGALFAVFVERGGSAEYDIARIGGCAMEARHQEYLRLLESIVQAAVDAGELRDDIPVPTIAAVLSGAMNGATYAWLTRRRTSRLSDVTPDLLSLFLAGARKPS